VVQDFPPVQTGPGAHTASSTMGTGSFPGIKYGRDVLLTTHTLLVPCSWKSRAILLPTLWATTGPVTGTLYLYILSAERDVEGNGRGLRLRNCLCNRRKLTKYSLWLIGVPPEARTRITWEEVRAVTACLKLTAVKFINGILGQSVGLHFTSASGYN
jgi:hypothetical protein